ncbi:MAG: hypothetical protein ACLGHL_07550, partial [Actinomycetota bacterium]
EMQALCLNVEVLAADGQEIEMRDSAVGHRNRESDGGFAGLAIGGSELDLWGEGYEVRQGLGPIADGRAVRDR